MFEVFECITLKNGDRLICTLNIWRPSEKMLQEELLLGTQETRPRKCSGSRVVKHTILGPTSLTRLVPNSFIILNLEKIAFLSIAREKAEGEEKERLANISVAIKAEEERIAREKA